MSTAEVVVKTEICMNPMWAELSACLYLISTEYADLFGEYCEVIEFSETLVRHQQIWRVALDKKRERNERAKPVCGAIGFSVIANLYGWRMLKKLGVDYWCLSARQF